MFVIHFEFYFAFNLCKLGFFVGEFLLIVLKKICGFFTFVCDDGADPDHQALDGVFEPLWLCLKLEKCAFSQGYSSIVKND